MPHIDYIGSDGKKWPSATELTQLLPQSWVWAWYKRSVQKDGWAGWLANNARSEIGKKIGTAVHGHLESWTIKGREPTEEVENSLELAKKLYDVVHLTVEEYVAIEPHLVSHKLKIHGTADIIYRKDGVLRIGDYKTNYKEDKLSHTIQLAVYALCWNEEHPKELIDDGDIFRIDKKSKKLNVKIDPYEKLQQYFPVVEALKTIWDHCYAEE